MAFLLPALAAAGTGLAAAAGSEAGKFLMHKVVGDAPPDQSLTTGEHSSLMLQRPEMMALTRPAPGHHEAIQSNDSQQFARPTEASALQNQITQLSQDSSTVSPSQLALYNNNLRSQSLADSAAMLQMDPRQAMDHYNQRMLDMSRNPQMSEVERRLLESAARASTEPTAAFVRPTPAQMGQTNLSVVSTLTPTIPTISNGRSNSSSSAIMGNSISSAPQPLFKLTTNQAHNIPSDNRNAPGNISEVASQGTNTSYSEIMKNMLASANNNLKTGLIETADRIGGQIGNTGATALSNLLNKGSAKAVSLLESSLGSIFKKIIGDGPPLHPSVFSNPALWSSFPSGMEKIVGDAVPTMPYMINKVIGDAVPGMLSEMGETMTPEQSEKAVTNLANSVLWQIMSTIVLNEQTLTTAVGLVNGLDAKSINRQIARMMTVVSGSFNQRAVSVSNGIMGSTILPVVMPFILSNGTTIDTTWGNYIQCVPYTSCSVQPTKISPPLGGNTTLDVLKPLLLGAATAEYSSQLRVNNSITNIDAMMRAVAATANNLTAGCGYDFSLPLIKALGYVLMKNPILGENMNTFAQGINCTPSTLLNSQGLDLRVSGGLFPCSYDGNNFSALKAATITEKNFILAATGGIPTAAWDPDFVVSNWGDDCAVVFVPAGSHTNYEMNLVRMLVELDYPAAFTYYSFGDMNWFYFNNVGNMKSFTRQNSNVDFPEGNKNYMIEAIPKASAVHIPGPKRAVLFVLMGNFTESTGTMTVGTGGHILGLSTDNSPAAPVEMNFDTTGDERNWFRDILGPKSSISLFSAYIREWESLYKNNSNRCTAMRFWADHSRVYGVNPVVASDISQGSPQASFGLNSGSYASGFADGMDLPAYSKDWANTFTIEINSESKVALVSAVATTASNIPTEGCGLTYNGATTGLRDVYYARVNPCDGAFTGNAILGAQDYFINYLVWKKWVYPLEEYPTTTISDPGRLAFTVALMSNYLAFITDSVYQSQSIIHSAAVAPFLWSSASTVRMMLENKLYPAVEMLMQNGIQFPTYYVNRQSFFGIESNGFKAIFLAHVYGGSASPLLDGTSLLLPARIPREFVGQNAPGLLPTWNKLQLNMPFMKPSRIVKQLSDELFNLFSISICPDDTGLSGSQNSIMTQLLSRISQGVVLLGTSPNPGFVAYNTRDGQIRPIFFNVRGYDESRNRLVAASWSSSALVLPVLSAIGLPMVEAPPNRDMRSGGDALKLASTGPVDVFGPGEGSYGYIMYYSMASGMSAVTTNIQAYAPESVYSGDGFMEALNYM